MCMELRFVKLFLSNEYVMLCYACMCVYLYVCVSVVSQELLSVAYDIFTNIFVHVTYSPDSILYSGKLATLRYIMYFRFMDDVIFA